MSIEIVFQQMIVIFIMVLIGYYLYRTSKLDEHSSKHISAIVSNVCNPVVIVNAALTNTIEIGIQEFFSGIVVSFSLYIVLILISFIIPKLLRVEKGTEFAYQMMAIYANTGFIGIPLVSAILPDALFYVTLNNIAYNIFFYTHGVFVIEKAASEKKTGQKQSFLKSFINMGTVSGVIALFLYIFPADVPTVLDETFHYVGRSTTFLSMLVMGVALGKMGMKNLFIRKKVVYIFMFIRLLVIPIGLTLIMKLFFDNELLVGANAFMLAVPAGNMPLIIAQQNDMDTEILSRGIILSTIFSIITIPIVTLVL
ncbi:MAG: AEC family transporter [Lachnospiraceae bacterium]